MPNVGPYIYDVSISGFIRSSIYIYDISSLRVNAPWHVKRRKWEKQCRKNFTCCSWNYIHVEKNRGEFIAKKINGIEFETTNVLVKCWG